MSVMGFYFFKWDNVFLNAYSLKAVIYQYYLTQNNYTTKTQKNCRLDLGRSNEIFSFLEQ